MKCKSCFRCMEDWRDVKAKGLKPQHSKPLYSEKPRRGVRVTCTAIGVEEITPNSKACGNFKHRAVWNARLLIGEIKLRSGRIFDVCIRVPIGGLRKPVRLMWKEAYDVMTDKIIPNGEPCCPHCGEMPYSTKRCVFCGQKFIQDEAIAEYNKPPETITTDCFKCGGKGTMVGTRSKVNGHFHGTCRKCGIRIIE